MPLTPFQRGVAQLIAVNRTPASHIAGGAVLNRGEAGLRISDDLDIFHAMMTVSQDSRELAKASADADAKLLSQEGYVIEWLLRAGGLHRAIVRRGNDHLRLDWVMDSAFRFFPAQQDAEFGYCLHRADLAVNKILALAGRSEIRDFIDILQLDREYLSVGAIAWAACGKDQGFTPSFIIEQSSMHSSYQDKDLQTH